MAHLHRLIFLALLALASWLPASSFAAISPLQGYDANLPGGSYTVVETTMAAACLTALPIWDAYAGGQYTPINYFPGGEPTLSSCGFLAERNLNAGGGTYVANNVAPRPAFYCPANATLSNGYCGCNDGYTEDDVTHASCNSIVPPSVCVDLVGQTTFISAPGRLSPGQTVCGSVGCNVVVAETVLMYVEKPTGNTVSQADATITAVACTYSSPTAGAVTPDTTAATDAAPTSCPGGALGQVNGLTVCVDYDPAVNTVSSTSTSASTSGATGPTGAASSTSSGSSITTCTGASCTTSTSTTTTPGTGGTPTTTTATSTQSKSEFCLKNPADALCKTTASSFGGACGAVPACTGDAVMCAVAAQSMKTACAMERVQDATGADYDAAKLKTGNQTADLAGNETVTLGSSNFDTTDAIGGGGGCISDKSVTIAGKTLTIPFSGVCAHLAMLGNVLMLVSFLLAGRIVVRG